MNKSVDDLCRIAANGAGLKLDANGFQVGDLSRIAAIAADKQTDIVIANADIFSTDDLCQIAANGEGCVFFE